MQKFEGHPEARGSWKKSPSVTYIKISSANPTWSRREVSVTDFEKQSNPHSWPCPGFYSLWGLTLFKPFLRIGITFPILMVSYILRNSAPRCLALWWLPPVLWKWSLPPSSELTHQHFLHSGCLSSHPATPGGGGFELSKWFAFAPLLPNNTRSINIVGDQVLQLKMIHGHQYIERVFAASSLPQYFRSQKGKVVDLKQKQKLENIISSKMRSLTHLWGGHNASSEGFLFNYPLFTVALLSCSCVFISSSMLPESNHFW